MRPGQPPAGGARSTARKNDTRRREGTQFNDQPGYFRITANRVTFFTANGTARFMGLENLNLELSWRFLTNFRPAAAGRAPSCGHLDTFVTLRAVALA